MPPVPTWNVLPIAPLRPWVDRIWGMAFRSEAPRALPLLLPGTGAEMFIHFGDPFGQVMANGATVPLPRSHLLALRTHSMDLAPARHLHFIAIRFKAGCASRFLAHPLAGCTDHPLPLADVEEESPGLEQRLYEAPNRAEQIELIEHFLLQRLAAAGSRDGTVARASQDLYYRSSGIEALAAGLGLGRRQLERRFKAQEGLSPVAFRQLARFQRTVKTLRLEPHLSLARAGLDFGFADQAHMSREVRAIAGHTPEQLRQALLARPTFYSPSWSRPGHGSIARP